MSPLNLYDSECKSGVENRIGLFPARFCLKVSGYKSNIYFWRKQIESKYLEQFDP